MLCTSFFALFLMHCSSFSFIYGKFVFIVLGFVECRKNDHQKLKEELERDFQHDFLSTCEVMIKMYNILYE